MKAAITSLLCGLGLFAAQAHAEYVITTDAQGIEVINNWNGKSVVLGKYVPNPIPRQFYAEEYPQPLQRQPDMIALDPAGNYLYAYYDEAAYSLYYSFRVNTKGTLTQVATAEGLGGPCASCTGFNVDMNSSAHYLFILNVASSAVVEIIKTSNGIMVPIGSFDVYFSSLLNLQPLYMQVDPSEHWMYMYYSKANTAVVDTVGIYNIQNLPKAPVFIGTKVITNSVLIVP